MLVLYHFSTEVRVQVLVKYSSFKRMEREAKMVIINNNIGDAVVFLRRLASLCVYDVCCMLYVCLLFM